MEIEINNGGKLRLSFFNDSLLVEEVNAKGEVESRRAISPGELVLLYDYYIMKKDNNEEIL